MGDTVKAKVDAIAPISSQECAAEETALLGLLCDLYSLTAALGVVALLKQHRKMLTHDIACLKKIQTDFVLTNFLSIFALMSLARVKKA